MRGFKAWIKCMRWRMSSDPNVERDWFHGKIWECGGFGEDLRSVFFCFKALL